MTSSPRQPADDLLAALAAAFDAGAPRERAPAEQELLDAGRDPRAVARRCAALAAEALGSAPAARREAARPRPRRPGLVWAAAAALALALAGALLAGRAQPERLARGAPAPRPVEPPAGRVAPSLVEEAAERPLAGAPGASGERAAAGGAAAAGGGAADDGVPAAADEALLALLPDAARPLARAGVLALHEVAVDPATIAGLQSEAFAAASAANAGQFEIVPPCTLRRRGRGVPPGERFGLPFPEPSAASPTVACEIVWNAEATAAAGGGRRGRATACGAAPDFGESPQPPAARCGEAHFVALALAGRADGPIANPDGLRAASLLRVFGLPDEAGVGLLSRRPLGDEAAQHWHYTGASRRVTDEPRPPLASDWLLLTLDDLDCFSGSPESYAWTLLGRQEVLAPLSGEGLALHDAAADVPAGATPAMRRPVWVVAGARGPDERIVLYVDRQLYRPYWKVVSRPGVPATYACAVGWAAPDGIVAPLTSSVTRYDAGGRIDRFAPRDEQLDARLGPDDLTLRALLQIDAP